MEIEEYLTYRNNLLNEAKDEEGFIDQQLVLSSVLPLMLDAKLIDSEDYQDSYFISEEDKQKINGYTVNESGERLQLFIVDESTIAEGSLSKELTVSSRSDYEDQFKRVTRFISEAIKGQLNEQIQDSDPVKRLLSYFASDDLIEQIDVIEVFLISLTATVSSKTATSQPRDIYFAEDKLKITYGTAVKRKKKELLLIRNVVDLNFLHKVIVSRGKRDPLRVDFRKTFGYGLEVIQAGNDSSFESYLCAMNAEVLADLYKRFSSRLLEKNVRSFLQFKGVNKGLKETIRNEPEKFIAYNNGLTITATEADFCHGKRNMLINSLSDLQIVNGGQTTASIYFAKKEGLDVSKVKVMAKINVVKASSNQKLEDLIAKISKFSNSQSRVSVVDLRSRSPELVRLKSLSESVLTPSGKKWFFERAKGEFNTELRKAGANSNRIKREYPSERRFSKEELAKYYCSWGDIPYLVKKGGEKIFRHFIEEISPNEVTGTSIEINRDFYENLISKIILFRQLENIYGRGKNTIGQLRSAVVPYVLSIVYAYTDAINNSRSFDFSKIWQKEDLDEPLMGYFKQLLILMNGLIKKYSSSEDFGEYSKKPELWNSIKSCPEISEFMDNLKNQELLERYTHLSSLSGVQLTQRRVSSLGDWDS